MRVLFEDAGWQIVSYGSHIAYIKHINCKEYVTLVLRSTNNKCCGCYETPPDNIQGLAILHNWGYE